MGITHFCRASCCTIAMVGVKAAPRQPVRVHTPPAAKETHLLLLLLEMQQLLVLLSREPGPCISLEGFAGRWGLGCRGLRRLNLRGRLRGRLRGCHLS